MAASVAALRALSMDKSKIESATREADEYYADAEREHTYLTNAIAKNPSKHIARIVQHLQHHDRVRRRLRLETRAASTRGFACSRRLQKALAKSWSAQHGGPHAAIGGDGSGATAAAAEKILLEKQLRTIEGELARLELRLQLHGRIFAEYAARKGIKSGRGEVSSCIGRALALSRADLRAADGHPLVNS